jgi:hypothetical protein
VPFQDATFVPVTFDAGSYTRAAITLPRKVQGRRARGGERSNGAARLWISGLEAVQRKLGIGTFLFAVDRLNRATLTGRIGGPIIEGAGLRSSTLPPGCPMRTRSLFALTAVVALTAPLPAHAQVEVDGGVIGGLYRPAGSFDVATIYWVPNAVTPQNWRGTARGVQLLVWPVRRLGAQVQAASASSETVAFNTPGAGIIEPRGMRVTTVSAQALVDLSPTRRLRLWIGGGGALVHHGGDIYEQFGPLTHTAMSFSGGIAVPLLWKLRATAGVSRTSYAFRIDMPEKLRGNGDVQQSGPQRDMLYQLGLVWAIH